MNRNQWQAGYEAVLSPEGVGFTHRTHRGLLELTGRDRQSFLQGMVSNDVAALIPGQSCHAALLDSSAHLLAELNIHCRPDSLMIETDASNSMRVSQTLDKFLIMEKVRIQDVSDQWAIVALQGQGAEALATKALEHYTGFQAIAHHSAVQGRDVFVPMAEQESLQEELRTSGAVYVMDDAWEILRIEAGIPAWGRELEEIVLLPEAGLTDAVSDTKGCYVGQEIVARIAARGHANRALRAILLAEGEAAPMPGDLIHLPPEGPDAGREIGRITSAVHSPKFSGRALALGYVRREHNAPGTSVSVHLRQPDGLVFVAPAEILMPGENGI
jgi:folate-binding protein YgfZ